MMAGFVRDEKPAAVCRPCLFYNNHSMQRSYNSFFQDESSIHRYNTTIEPLYYLGKQKIMTNSNMPPRNENGADFHRPRYHFLPPNNWMNDPNGLIQWNGQYHLFYQHNPFGPLWGNMHWGHAVSDDLVHWRDLPLALHPTPDGPDADGCFSGCAVNNNGVPTLIYTGNGPKYQTQCVATSHDDLLTWQKHAANPVIKDVPADANGMIDIRDPFVWQADDMWYMVIGSGVKDVGGTVFLYRSENLTDWEYLSPILVGDKSRTGVIWECPNLFQLGDKWVLIVSMHNGNVPDTVYYFVGHFENHRFVPIYENVLDYGYLYAPLVFKDDNNRRIMVGWLREGRPDVHQYLSGWSGVQSIPRELALDAQNRLIMTPVTEMGTIRGTKHAYHMGDIQADTFLDVAAMTLDIEAIFQPITERVCGLRLFAASDDSEYTDLYYDANQQKLIIKKVTRAALHATVTHIREVPHRLDANEQLHLRILLDGSVAEIIANGRTSFTNRVYASHADHNRIKVIGAVSQLRALTLWEMDSIWD